MERVITVEELRAERGHLTHALLEANWEAGQFGVVCRYPRTDTIEPGDE